MLDIRLSKKTILRLIASLLTGNEEQTNTVLQLQVIPRLLWLLDSPDDRIIENACWVLSNVTAQSNPRSH